MNERNVHITKEEALFFFKKIVEDKKAICECVSKKGDLDKLVKERGIKIAAPIQYSK